MGIYSFFKRINALRRSCNILQSVEILYTDPHLLEDFGWSTAECMLFNSRSFAPDIRLDLVRSFCHKQATFSCLPSVSLIPAFQISACVWLSITSIPAINMQVLKSLCTSPCLPAITFQLVKIGLIHVLYSWAPIIFLEGCLSWHGLYPFLLNCFKGSTCFLPCFKLHFNSADSYFFFNTLHNTAADTSTPCRKCWKNALNASRKSYFMALAVSGAMLFWFKVLSTRENWTFGIRSS